MPWQFREEKLVWFFILQSRCIVHYGQEDINRRIRQVWQSRSRLITTHRKQRERTKKWDKAMQPQCLPELQTSSSIVPTSQMFYHLPKQHLPGTLYWNIRTYGWGAEFQFQITIFNITPAWQPHAGLSKLFVTHNVSCVIFLHCFPMYYLVSYWGKHVQATAQKWAEERHSNRL